MPATARRISSIKRGSFAGLRSRLRKFFHRKDFPSEKLAYTPSRPRRSRAFFNYSTRVRLRNFRSANNFLIAERLWFSRSQLFDKSTEDFSFTVPLICAKRKRREKIAFLFFLSKERFCAISHDAPRRPRIRRRGKRSFCFKEIMPALVTLGTFRIRRRVQPV